MSVRGFEVRSAAFRTLRLSKANFRCHAVLTPAKGGALGDKGLPCWHLCDMPTGTENVRSCAGFRTPARGGYPRAAAAGVRKAPMHEVAGSWAPDKQRAL